MKWYGSPVALIWLSLAASQLSHAQPANVPAATIETSEQITKALSAHDVDSAITALGKAMASPTTAETMRANFQALKQFGNSQYIDRVYLRDFGKTTRDIIYKINYDNSIVYVRYLFSLEAGSWRLIHFNYKNESAAPFPKEWTHIFPG